MEDYLKKILQAQVYEVAKKTPLEKANNLSKTLKNNIFLKREEECLAGCCGAPMMQVNHVYHEHLTIDDVDEILDNLK